MTKIDYTTIEEIHGHFWYCQNGFYDRSSVLAYQPFRQLVRSYHTIEEAIAAHPDAEVIDYCSYEQEHYHHVPSYLPVDSEICGEVWDE
jgi:hypothetical protein